MAVLVPKQALYQAELRPERQKLRAFGPYRNPSKEPEKGTLGTMRASKSHHIPAECSSGVLNTSAH